MLKRVAGDIDLDESDILVVGCFRNERLRLPWFLTHHRAIGVNWFLLIDNDSDDGSVEFLLEQDDVVLFHTEQTYSEGNFGMAWQNAVLSDLAIGHWTLILDADEIFVFPGYESIQMRQFVDYIENRGADAAIAPLLDMYSDGPIVQTGYVAGENLIERCPFFDASGYELAKPGSNMAGLPIRGGPRERLFWSGRDWDFPPPYLMKIPLIRWRAELRLEASTHMLKGVATADVSGMLLHFKLLQDFSTNAEREVHRKEHFADARQYRAYEEIMLSNAGLAAHWAGSVRFEDSAQLCRLGLMRVPADYPFPVGCNERLVSS